MVYITNKKLISVDFDGVLIDNNLEDALFERASSHNLSYDDTSPLWDWYDRLLYHTDRPLNVELLRWLGSIRDRFFVELWTNRAYTLRSYTMRNLNGFKNIFSGTNFYGGRKNSSVREGVVIDNDVSLLKCGEHGIHYRRCP